MSTWNVYCPDVWGNENDGWVVNNQFLQGQIELENDEDVASIVSTMEEDGYLRPIKEGELTVDIADEDFTHILDSETGEPVYHLVRQID